MPRPAIVRLPTYRDQFEELGGWIDSAHPGPITVLDVGGGGEFYDFATRLRPRATRMVGVDPDARVTGRPWFDDAYTGLVEDYALAVGALGAAAIRRAEAGGGAGAPADPFDPFDLALCVYVVEHVDSPGPFLEAIRSLLGPGGSCFGVTPNLWHYFGLTSALATRLGAEEWLLHRVRPNELIEAYHSPVRYRLNTIRQLRRTALDAGFQRAEFRVLEQPGMFRTYLPGPLRWWAPAYSTVVNRVGPPALFGTVMFRLIA